MLIFFLLSPMQEKWRDCQQKMVEAVVTVFFVCGRHSGRQRVQRAPAGMDLFQSVHRAQLASAGIPERLHPKLFRKLQDEVRSEGVARRGGKLSLRPQRTDQVFAPGGCRLKYSAVEVCRHTALLPTDTPTCDPATV